MAHVPNCGKLEDGEYWCSKHQLPEHFLERAHQSKRSRFKRKALKLVRMIAATPARNSSKEKGRSTGYPAKIIQPCYELDDDSGLLEIGSSSVASCPPHSTDGEAVYQLEGREVISTQFPTSITKGLEVTTSQDTTGFTELKGSCAELDGGIPMPDSIDFSPINDFDLFSFDMLEADPRPQSVRSIYPDWLVSPLLAPVNVDMDDVLVNPCFYSDCEADMAEVDALDPFDDGSMNSLMLSQDQAEPFRIQPRDLTINWPKFQSPHCSTDGLETTRDDLGFDKEASSSIGDLAIISAILHKQVSIKFCQRPAPFSVGTFQSIVLDEKTILQKGVEVLLRIDKGGLPRSAMELHAVLHCACVSAIITNEYSTGEIFEKISSSIVDCSQTIQSEEERCLFVEASEWIWGANSSGDYPQQYASDSAGRGAHGSVKQSSKFPLGVNPRTHHHNRTFCNCSSSVLTADTMQQTLRESWPVRMCWPFLEREFKTVSWSRVGRI